MISMYVWSGIRPARKRVGNPFSRRCLAGTLVVTLIAVSCGSPSVRGQSSEGVFDHSLLDGVLKKYVNEKGLVDYRRLLADSDSLDRYIESLENVTLEGLPSSERLTLLINAYNAFSLRLILDHYPVKSIRDVPRRDRWSDARWRIGNNVWSLDQIEHGQIRPHHEEPRIHFALMTSALGSPPLRNEAYQPERLEKQLEDQARRTHSNQKWCRFDKKKNTVYLSKVYKWFSADFVKATTKGEDEGSVLKYAARYVPTLATALKEGKKPKIEWLDYNWRLNDQHPVK